MDAKDFNRETRTEDPGSDIEEFVAILDRMKALKKVRRQPSEEGQRKIIGDSHRGWMPSFDWEDFCDHAIADGGIKIPRQRGGGEGEVQGSNIGPNKRLREDAESPPRARRLKADIFRLKSDDPEDPKLAFTVGLPAFS